MFKRKPHCEPTKFALSGFQCDLRQVNLQRKSPQQVSATNAPTTLPKGSKFLQILPGLMVKKSSPSVSASTIRFAIFVHLSLQPAVVRFQSACTGSAAVAKAINDFVWSCECCVCCQLFQPEKKTKICGIRHLLIVFSVLFPSMCPNFFRQTCILQHLAA